MCRHYGERIDNYPPLYPTNGLCIINMWIAIASPYNTQYSLGILCIWFWILFPYLFVCLQRVKFVLTVILLHGWKRERERERESFLPIKWRWQTNWNWFVQTMNNYQFLFCVQCGSRSKCTRIISIQCFLFFILSLACIINSNGSGKRMARKIVRYKIFVAVPVGRSDRAHHFLI